MKRAALGLIWLPTLFVYVSSYLYLCGYHGTFFPLFSVVHEGGKLTLWETALYAPHFLGHLPVIMTVGFFFCGIWLCLTPVPLQSKGSFWRRSAILALFLTASLLLSLWVFGAPETTDFVLQRKQSETVSGEGGAWSLHLPSTMLLPFLIPAYLLAFVRCFNLPAQLRLRGLWWIGAGFLLAAIMTWATNDDPVQAVVRVWSSPRYLGHSVRELMTFPLTYFPPALYYLLRELPGTTSKRRQKAHGVAILAGLTFSIFLLGLAYQSWETLQVGVGQLAQKPAFARSGQLGIPYLLSSHYFEHLLDSVFFVLFCRLLIRIR